MGRDEQLKDAEEDPFYYIALAINRIKLMVELQFLLLSYELLRKNSITLIVMNLSSGYRSKTESRARKSQLSRV